MRRALLLVGALGVAACAPVPRPDALGAADQAGKSALAADARVHAPSAVAHAEKLRRDAEAAFAAGDQVEAQFLAEHAVAAYAHAHALARMARAQAATRAAEGELSRSQSELTALDADQAREATELAALETRIKVVRDAQAVVPSGPADPARERARLAAARNLALQGRLLCGAARLLLADRKPPAAPGQASPAAPAPTPRQERGLLAEPRRRRGGGDDGARQARRRVGGRAGGGAHRSGDARARCVPGRAHRGATRADAGVARAGAGDALLAELGAMSGMSPARDDRGVVVTLRAAFRGDALTAAAQKALGDLGRVAAAHPGFPVVVVVHDAEGKGNGQARADAASGALRAAGVARTDAVLAGTAAPLVDPAGSDRSRNARLEVVFVTPETF
ncbi:MAG: hypothetical protein WKG00_24355 [Polyangiaceae bacterium]